MALMDMDGYLRDILPISPGCSIFGEAVSLSSSPLLAIPPHSPANGLTPGPATIPRRSNSPQPPTHLTPQPPTHITPQPPTPLTPSSTRTHNRQRLLRSTPPLLRPLLFSHLFAAANDGADQNEETDVTGEEDGMVNMSEVSGVGGVAQDGEQPVVVVGVVRRGGSTGSSISKTLMNIILGLNLNSDAGINMSAGVDTDNKDRAELFPYKPTISVTSRDGVLVLDTTLPVDSTHQLHSKLSGLQQLASKEIVELRKREARLRQRRIDENKSASSVTTNSTSSSPKEDGAERLEGGDSPSVDSEADELSEPPVDTHNLQMLSAVQMERRLEREASGVGVDVVTKLSDLCVLVLTEHDFEKVENENIDSTGMDVDQGETHQRMTLEAEYLLNRIIKSSEGDLDKGMRRAAVLISFSGDVSQLTPAYRSSLQSAVMEAIHPHRGTGKDPGTIVGDAGIVSPTIFFASTQQQDSMTAGVNGEHDVSQLLRRHFDAVEQSRRDKKERGDGGERRKRGDGGEGRERGDESGELESEKRDSDGKRTLRDVSHIAERLVMRSLLLRSPLASQPSDLISLTSSALCPPDLRELTGTLLSASAASDVIRMMKEELSEVRARVESLTVVSGFGKKVGMCLRRAVKRYRILTEPVVGTSAHASITAATVAALEKPIKRMIARQVQVLQREAKSMFEGKLLDEVMKSSGEEREVTSDAFVRAVTETLNWLSSQLSSLIPPPDVGTPLGMELTSLPSAVLSQSATSLMETAKSFGASPKAQLLMRRLSVGDADRDAIRKPPRGMKMGVGLTGMVRGGGAGNLQAVGNYQIGPLSLNMGYANDRDLPESRLPDGSKPPSLRFQPKVHFDVQL
eukprot:GHVN01094167.1.p1 GENE.GHVN01094167.1~~GHVN01094167.1.p1  ORF type:complete len:857 (+),score=248.70 GHVN01094167.1:176-2746(+)